MKYLNFLLNFAMASILLFDSCKKDEEKWVAPEFTFHHNVNGSALQKSVMIYTNLAGNNYEVDELQYFISEITLKTASGQLIPITSDSAIHYVDLAIPSTLSWKPADQIPTTDYDSISFVFGINEAKNKTGLFVNPPQRDMFWPDMMGGGYHYMKMNGKWKATGDLIKAFNFHLGIGMGDMGMFYQNYFKVTLPLKFHTMANSNQIEITMNIEKWFEAPNLWDWNVIGGQIMQNQDAMHKACENGAHVFGIAFKGN
jgi:hypothetical protein